jgi:hypothetical protein
VNLADAAEEVLRQGDGRSLTSREITDRAMALGLIAPRSATPWKHLAAALREDIVRREQRGEPVRFSAAGSGRFQLSPTN